MRYFTDDEKAAWHDDRFRRLVSGDPCAPVRIFFERLDSWLQSIESEHPGLLQMEFGDAGKLLDSMKAVRATLSEYFILPVRGSFEQFVRTTEISAKRLLDDHFAPHWQLFLAAAHQRPDYSAIQDLISCLNRVDRLVNGPACPAAFTASYPNYVRSNWVHVRNVLYNCETIPMEAIGVLWHFLSRFLLEQREHYGLNLRPGWWTDVAEGKFRHLTADEVAAAKKAAGIDDASGTRTLSGRAEDIIDQLFFQPPEEGRVYIVNIKNDNNRTRHEITLEALDSIRAFCVGNTPESRLFEVLSHNFNAANTLAEIAAASSARNEHRKAGQRGTRRNQQKAGQVADWAVASAQILLDAYPAMTISEIAKLLASQQEREKAANQLTSPDAQAQLRQAPPRAAGFRSVFDKLSAAVKDGRLSMPASKPA